jgi:hypothetical protein
MSENNMSLTALDLEVEAYVREIKLEGIEKCTHDELITYVCGNIYGFYSWLKTRNLIAPPNLTSELADGTAPEPECKLFCDHCKAWVACTIRYYDNKCHYLCNLCQADLASTKP